MVIIEPPCTAYTEYEDLYAGYSADELAAIFGCLKDPIYYNGITDPWPLT